MNEQIVGTLSTLKDLEGILGSFLIGPKGAIIAQDLPSYFGSAAYDIGPRAQRLQEALAMSEGEVAHCILRYGAHKVALRPLQGGLLTIVSESSVNMPALRMAMNLVARKLESQAFVVSFNAHSTPPSPTIRPTPPRESLPETKHVPTSGSLAAPEATGSRPSSKERPVYFRGKRIS